MLFPPQKVYATMPWVQPASNATNPTWEHEGIWMQCFPMPYPSYYQDEISRTPVHDRLGPRQSGPKQHAAPVRLVLHDLSDRSHWGRPKMLLHGYCVKGKEQKVQPATGSEKTRADVVVHIGDIKVVVKDNGKGPIVLGKSASSPIQKPIMANDLEAGSSKAADKYHQPR